MSFDAWRDRPRRTKEITRSFGLEGDLITISTFGHFDPERWVGTTKIDRLVVAWVATFERPGFVDLWLRRGKEMRPTSDAPQRVWEKACTVEIATHKVDGGRWIRDVDVARVVRIIAWFRNDILARKKIGMPE